MTIRKRFKEKHPRIYARILECQQEQSREPNDEVMLIRAFSWRSSTEGENFWNTINKDETEKYQIFYDMYPEEFVLPEKWSIKPENLEQAKIIAKYFDDNKCGQKDYIYFKGENTDVNSYYSNKGYGYGNNNSYTLITFEQFQQYVLKESELATQQEVIKSVEKTEILIFGKYKIEDIVVSLSSNNYRAKGELFKVLPNPYNKHNTESLYYESSTCSSAISEWRIATQEEKEAFEKGIKNINDIKVAEKFIIGQWYKFNYDYSGRNITIYAKCKGYDEKGFYCIDDVYYTFEGKSNIVCHINLDHKNFQYWLITDLSEIQQYLPKDHPDRQETKTETMEEFKVGDWVYGEKSKDGDWRRSAFIPVFQIKEIPVNNWLRPEKGVPSGVHKMNCRKALPHEIPTNTKSETIVVNDELRVGDRVECVAPNGLIKKGMQGTLIVINTDKIFGISWDNFTAGHDLSGNLKEKRNSGQWIYKKYLKKIPNNKLNIPSVYTIDTIDVLDIAKALSKTPTVNNQTTNNQNLEYQQPVILKSKNKKSKKQLFIINNKKLKIMSVNTTVKKGMSFAKEVLAKLKGDDAAALSEKIARKAVSAVEGQLAALRAKEVDLENNLENANKGLHNAKYLTIVFTNNQFYIESIQRAQSVVDNATEDLQAVRDSIKFFEELLASF